MLFFDFFRLAEILNDRARVLRVEGEAVCCLERLQLGEIDLENPGKSVDSMPFAWWNLWFQWMGLYFVVVLVCAIAFRFALGVN